MRPKQLVSVYLNERDQSTPPVTPTPLAVKANNTTVVADTTTINFPSSQFLVQGFGQQANVSDYAPFSQSSDQQLVTLADTNIITNVVLTDLLSMRVIASYYRDKSGKGIYNFGFYMSCSGTNGAGQQSFRVNIPPFFPDYYAPPAFTGVPIAFPGYQGWQTGGAYTNNALISVEATGVTRQATVTFVSATQIQVTLFNTDATQFLNWSFTWVQ